MNSKSFRRLAADHSALHTTSLPPNYLFDPATDGSADLTSLDILLAGPVGTPYSSGVWRLHLDIPPNYPTAPPTAQFRTRLWHPNIDEATGAVCVETLKRDWTSTLKLKDVLVTISCLLIQPNPASALNEAAGKLASEDWDGFCRRAKLMTEIHAAVPSTLATEVKEAQMRGEDKESISGPSIPKPQMKGKQKEAAQATSTVAKIQRTVIEDEENTRRRAQTQELESDPESDWIPGPDRTNKSAAVRTESNVLGIKGLDESMQLDAPAKRIFSSNSVAEKISPEAAHDDSDLFVTVTSKRGINKNQHDKRIPLDATIDATNTDISTPDVLKFIHKNPFSTIQLNNQSSILSQEFSYSWEESEILHDTDMIKNGTSKLDVRKRMAGEDFEKKQAWELKKFKKSGYDLSRYNRGDWGPRTGLGRL